MKNGMIPHGTVSGYQYHKCRCVECCRAKREYKLAYDEVEVLPVPDCFLLLLDFAFRARSEGNDAKCEEFLEVAFQRNSPQSEAA